MSKCSLPDAIVASWQAVGIFSDGRDFPPISIPTLRSSVGRSELREQGVLPATLCLHSLVIDDF
jgi:hypothetical protein